MCCQNSSCSFQRENTGEIHSPKIVSSLCPSMFILFITLTIWIIILVSTSLKFDCIPSFVSCFMAKCHHPKMMIFENSEIWSSLISTFSVHLKPFSFLSCLHLSWVEQLHPIYSLTTSFFHSLYLL